MREIALEEQFLPLSTIFYYQMLDFYVKTGIRFSLRDKRLFEITEVEITRVDYNVPYTGETAKNAPSDQTAFKVNMIRFATGAPGNFAQNCASRLCISKTLNKSIVLSSTYNIFSL